MRFTLLLITVFFHCNGSKIKECNLAKRLQKDGEISNNDIPYWICFSNYSSGLETSNKQGPFCDGSFSYGIFNIPGKYCGDGGICGISCEKLMDTPYKDDIDCAIVAYGKDGSGFRNRCKYLSNCDQDKLMNLDDCKNVQGD